MNERENERALFVARMEDLFKRAARYEPCYGPFLSPAEQHAAKQRLKTPPPDVVCFFYGGYDGSERNRLFVLPEYLAPMEGECDAAFVRGTLPQLSESAVSVLAVRGSGYKKLSHRDYLGTLLALGIDREKIGDIVVQDDSHALVFCDSVIADYLLCELQRIGGDTVKLKKTEVADDFTVERRMRPISDTVASPRLDSIVSSLIGTSREKAKVLIEQGLVEVDYEVCDRNDKMPPEGAVISVRGHGKYVIQDVSQQTKKGRYRLLAAQYV